MPTDGIKRRELLKGMAATGLLAGVPWIVPSTALGRGTRPAPSNRITLGVIGCGGMGNIDLNNFLGLNDVDVLALCDVDDERTAASERVVAEHERTKLGRSTPTVKTYRRFEDVLARPDIDAVLIATPDHWHAGIAIAAAKAGKDIYGEKPLARTIREQQDMIRVVERHGVVFQMGTQTRSHAGVQHIVNLLRAGVIGNIRRVELNVPQYGGMGIQERAEVPAHFDYERWLGPTPWRPYVPFATHNNFRVVLDFSGGTITDHGTHRLDVAQWGTNHEHEGPVRIEGEAQYPADGPFDAPTVARFEMTFRDGTVYHCVTESDQLKWGVKFIGDEGWIMVPMMAPLPHLPITASNPRLLDIKLTPSQRVVYPSDNHWANFIECCRTRGRTAQTIQVGHRSTTLCHLANIAMELGRPVEWDDKLELFPNDPAANAKLDRPKRMPWARFFQL